MIERVCPFCEKQTVQPEYHSNTCFFGHRSLIRNDITAICFLLPSDMPKYHYLQVARISKALIVRAADKKSLQERRDINIGRGRLLAI